MLDKIKHFFSENNLKKNYVIRKYGLKYGLPEVDISNLFKNFSIKLNTFLFLDDGSTPMDIALLKKLVIDHNLYDYLEIGTWRGESVLNVSEVSKECFTIDLPEEELKCKNENFKKNIGILIKNNKKIKQIRVNSKKFDFSSLKKKFDLIFVDGDHSYISVRKDTENVFKLLKNKKSMIVWHDYCIVPGRINWVVLSGILDGLPRNEQKNLYYVSNTLCAIYTKQNLKSENVFYPVIPNKAFEVTIKSRNLNNY